MGFAVSKKVALTQALRLLRDRQRLPWDIPRTTIQYGDDTGMS